MVKLNVIIPMAGLGSLFTEYGFTENKYLLPIDRKLTKMIEKAILTLNIEKTGECQFIFIIREENGPDNILRDYLMSLCSHNNYLCQILSVDKLTEGPVCTTYLAKELINNDTPLIVSNSDQILDWNIDAFLEKSMQYDGCVLTYRPEYELVIGATDKHSFVKFDEHGVPIEFIEKVVISDEALIGVHFYKKGKYFVESAEYLFDNNIRAPNGEFYLSYTYQALLNMKHSVGTHLLSQNEHFYPVGEPVDYFNYYNRSASIFVLSLIPKTASLSLETNPFFNIFHGNKNDTVEMNSELIIMISGSIVDQPTIFTSGERLSCQLAEDSCFCRIPNIRAEYQAIDPRQYVRGWLVGDFTPCIQRETDYEVAYLSHNKGERWGYHYHKEAKEINVLVSGKMLLNNIEISTGDMFIIDNNIIACPIFLEDCKVLCIKLPSVPRDKYII
jgi:hypothetical protein